MSFHLSKYLLKKDILKRGRRQYLGNISAEIFSYFYMKENRKYFIFTNFALSLLNISTAKKRVFSQ